MKWQVIGPQEAERAGQSGQFGGLMRALRDLPVAKRFLVSDAGTLAIIAGCAGIAEAFRSVGAEIGNLPSDCDEELMAVMLPTRAGTSVIDPDQMRDAAFRGTRFVARPPLEVQGQASDHASPLAGMIFSVDELSSATGPSRALAGFPKRAEGEDNLVRRAEWFRRRQDK